MVISQRHPVHIASKLGLRLPRIAMAFCLALGLVALGAQGLQFAIPEGFFVRGAVDVVCHSCLYHQLALSARST